MTLQFTIPNMACSACADTIAKAVRGLDPAASINADPKSKRVSVETQVNETAIREAITTAGYTVD